MLREKHLLTADHIRAHFQQEITCTGAVIGRANRVRWEKEDGRAMRDRVAAKVERLIAKCPPARLADESRADLAERMSAEGRRHGCRLGPLVKLEGS